MKLRDIEITNWADAPMAGDGFVIEMANNEAVYTNIAEVTEDSITLFMDDLGTELLEDAGSHHQKLVQLIGKAGDNAGDMLHDLLGNFKDTSGLADHAREMYADVAIENGLHQDDDHEEIEERLLDELMDEAGMEESKSQGDAWYIEQDAKRMAEKDGKDWESMPYGYKMTYRQKAASMRSDDDDVNEATVKIRAVKDKAHLKLPTTGINRTFDGPDAKEHAAKAKKQFEKDGYHVVYEAEYQGRKVKLGKPMAGDVKKFKVYVRDPKTGNVKKVNFGQKGVKIKKSNPARRKSFRARHNCSNPGPRTKARYWSCRKW